MLTISPIYNNTGSNSWTKAIIDLSNYTNITVQIGFYFHSQDNCYSTLTCEDVGPGWYIDDIRLETGPKIFNNPEGFDNGVGDWNVNRGTWQIGQPTSGPGTGYNSLTCAGTRLAGNYDEWVDSRLISVPFIVGDSSKNPRFTFFQWYNFNSGDFGEVQARLVDSTWTPVSDSSFVTLASIQPGTNSGGWGNSQLISLLNYTNQTIQIAFYFHSQDNCFSTLRCEDVGPGWFIDDITYIGVSTNIATGDDDTPLYFSDILTYPNPFEDKINISINSKQPKASIKIFDTLGSIVFNRDLEQSNGTFNVENLGKLTHGLYFLTISNSSFSSTYKILKE